MRIGKRDLEWLRELDNRMDQRGFSWQHLDYIVLRDTLYKLLDVYDAWSEGRTI
jgi:hypothetical protein